MKNLNKQLWTLIIQNYYKINKTKISHLKDFYNKKSTFNKIKNNPRGLR